MEKPHGTARKWPVEPLDLERGQVLVSPDHGQGEARPALVTRPAERWRGVPFGRSRFQAPVTRAMKAGVDPAVDGHWRSRPALPGALSPWSGAK